MSATEASSGEDRQDGEKETGDIGGKKYALLKDTVGHCMTAT